MAIDTRAKRASAVGILLGAFILAPPVPDGGPISTDDRLQGAWAYSGTSADVGTPSTGTRVIELPASLFTYDLIASL